MITTKTQRVSDGFPLGIKIIPCFYDDDPT